MNTLRDTDEGRARPSVWPVNLAAAGPGLIGLVFLILGIVNLAQTVQLIFEGHYAAMLRLGSPWGLPFFYLGVGLWGIIWALGLVRLRPWGWWYAAISTGIFTASYLYVAFGFPWHEGGAAGGAMIAMLLLAALPAFIIIVLLVWVLATRRQLFF